MADISKIRVNGIEYDIKDILAREGETAEIYMRVNGGYIQFSTDGTTWTNIIAVADLKGDKGDKGDTGADGQDGYTPQKGVDYFDGADGRDGADGQDGYTPVKGVDYFDGEDGADGADGQDGQDGHTPQKGVDYWTNADKQEIVSDVINALPTWTGGNY